MSRNNIPYGTPVQVFPMQGGIALTKDEYLERLQAKLKLTSAAIAKGVNLFEAVFEVDARLVREFGSALFDVLTAGIPEQIEFLSNLKDPEPIKPGEFPIPSGYRPTPEQLIEAQEQYEHALGYLEKAQAQLEKMPEEARAYVEGIIIPQLEQNLRNAQGHRDYLQKAMEQQEEK